MAQNTKLLNHVARHLPRNSTEKLKGERFILNGDLAFYDKEDIILSDVIDFSCLKTEQFFKASVVCRILNEMVSLSSPGYCSSDVEADSLSCELLPSEQPFCTLIISIPALGSNSLHHARK